MTKFEQDNLQTLAKSVDVMEQIYPEAMGHYYPRRYSAPGGHYSPRLMGGSYASLATSILDSDFFERVYKDWTLNCTIVIAARLALLGMPTYWITQEFAEMVMEAQPPPDMKVSDIEWPLEGLSIMLPHDTIHDPSGSPVMWISFCRAETGMESLLLPKTPGVIQNDLNGMSMCAYTASGCYYAQTLPNDAVLVAPMLEGIQYGESLKQIMGEEVDIERLQVSPEQDQQFNVRLAGMVANILMYMMAAKDGDFVARHDGGVARKARPQKGIDALWNPSWIGRDYQHPAGCRNLGGTHASPRTHWRRAHYRRQHYGPGRSMTKMLLVPRKLVNAATPAQTTAP